MKYTVTLLLCLAFATFASSQSERLHLHTDRQYYYPGETIWYKAYITNNHTTEIKSTNLYTELWDDNGKLAEKKVHPIIDATADGWYKIPDSVTGTCFYLRAFTKWMKDTDSSYLFTKKINILTQAKSKTDTLPPLPHLQFFAEGGNMINGFENYIAFKCSYNNGRPFMINGTVKNNRGDSIAAVAALHDGMGIFRFIPLANETYYCTWKDNTGQWVKTPLPAATENNIALHIERVGNRIYYLIKNPLTAAALENLSITAVMNGKTIYTARLDMRKETMLAEHFTADSLPTGIVQITVYNKEMQPMAERIYFVDNGNYSFAPQFTWKQTGTAKRSLNKIEILAADSFKANMSVAVYDASLTDDENAATIYSSLLFANDIRGYIHNPGWYFADTTIIRKQYLDLVMCTNGWRRYNWDAVQPPENYLMVYGKATDDKKLPLAQEPLDVILLHKDSTQNWYLAATDSSGLFKINGLVFYDSSWVYYKLNNSKNKAAAVGFGTYNGVAEARSYFVNPLKNEITEQPQQNQQEYVIKFREEIKNKNPLFEQKGKTLNEIVVKGRINSYRNDDLRKMDEKYATMFRGNATTMGFDVLNDPAAKNTLDVYNYITNKIPGLTVRYKGFTKTLVDQIHGAVSTVAANGSNGQEPVLFIDESEVSNENIANLVVENIAYMKYYDRFPLRQGLPPALCIYMKKADDYKADARKLPSNLSKIKIAGYAPIKEFYSPDYAAPENLNDKKPDLRTTLYWQPYVITDKSNVKAVINFYNNDFTKRLKLVLEGMDEEGRLVHIEKVIE